jgi:hypothetical protein
MEDYREVILGYRSIFQKAKHEVFVLIKDDNYARWRKTMTFSTFFKEIHIYNPSSGMNNDDFVF